jgi:hypothetical protein
VLLQCCHHRAWCCPVHATQEEAAFTAHALQPAADITADVNVAVSAAAAAAAAAASTAAATRKETVALAAAPASGTATGALCAPGKAHHCDPSITLFNE